MSPNLFLYPLVQLNSMKSVFSLLNLKVNNLANLRGQYIFPSCSFSIMTCNNTSSKPQLTLVTGNSNKLREIVQILGESFPYQLVNKNEDLPEYQGDADSVSIQKCKQAYEVLKIPVVIEDTCLCFNALGGLPGPYVKWFLQNVGAGGLHKMLQGFDDHSGYALATLAYYDGKSDIKLFKGITKGKIVSPRGDCGFGWDSCFMPDGYDITYAQMSAEEKNAISHRKRAVEAMREYFMSKN